MTQAITYSVAPLLGQDVITTAATPLVGHINPYDATTGPLAPVLLQASLRTLGTTLLAKKVDASGNAITMTCYPGDTFSDGTTARTLTGTGDFLVLSPVAVAVADGGDGIARWEVVGSGLGTPTGPGRFFDGGSASTASYGPPTDGGGANTTYSSPPTDGGAASTAYGGVLTIDGGTA